MSLLISVAAQVVCDECASAVDAVHLETGARKAARAAARAAGWKRRVRETPRTCYWIDVCAECIAKEAADVKDA